MKISLIKQLNENVREKDEYELALEKAGLKSNPVKESIDDYFPDDEDLSDIEGDVGYEGDDIEGKFRDESEMGYRDNGQGGAQEMGDDLDDEIAMAMAGEDPEAIVSQTQDIRGELGYENEEDTMEIQRIVDEYANSDLSDDEIFDAVGNDLEMLEYPPEEVEKLVPVIMSMIKKNTKYMDMSDALADGPQVDDAGNEYIP